MSKEKLKQFFDAKAGEIESWEKKNKYYYKDLEKICSFLIPVESSVLEIGCGTGNLLSALKPSRGVGVDISSKMVEIARLRHPHLEFHSMDAENLNLNEKFDYIVLSNLLGYLDDIEKVFHELQKVVRPESKIIITYHSYLWEPILKIGEKIGLRSPQPALNWLAYHDLVNLLSLANFEIIKKGKRLLLPKYIPLLSSFLNRFLDKLPLLNRLCLTEYLVAKPKTQENNWQEKYSVSVVIPARNEKGNIEEAVKRLPKLGKHTEIIFVEGHSTDGTWQEIRRVAEKYSNIHDIKIMQQDGCGKGDAVRKGFEAASGDILMILDADLTVRPEDLPKFYGAIASGKGEFINGCRLVYQMEGQAMRFLNMLGNKFFGAAFTWLLGQKFKDTLCGTKVLFKKDYEKIKAGRKFFGDFDPFGDFDLLFGAAKLNLKIVEMPIRYQARTYGQTNISRFRHGWLLLKMCVFAARKIKFI